MSEEKEVLVEKEKASPLMDPLAEKEKASPLMDPLAENLQKPPVISEEDKEKFFRAFLTDSPFEEETSLFGNKFKIKFKTMTVEQNDDLFQQIAVDTKLDIAKSQDSYFVKIMLRRLVSCLVSINGVSFAPDITKEAYPIDEKTGQSFLTKRAAILEKQHGFKLSIIIEAFRTFEKKVDILSKEALSENFWKAAE